MELRFNSIINHLDFLYNLYEQNSRLVDGITLTKAEYTQLLSELEDQKVSKPWLHHEGVYNQVKTHQTYYSLFLNIVD